MRYATKENKIQFATMIGSAIDWIRSECEDSTIEEIRKTMIRCGMNSHDHILQLTRPEIVLLCVELQNTFSGNAPIWALTDAHHRILAAAMTSECRVMREDTLHHIS